MKNTKLICAIVFFIMTPPFLVNAQLNSESSFITGSFGYSTNTSKYKSGSTTTKGNTDINFNVGPTFMYMLSDQLAAGVSLSYSNTIIKIPGEIGDTRNSYPAFSFAPFARYYIINSGNLGVFGQVKLSVGRGKEKSKTTIGNTTISTENNLLYLSAYISPGINYFFNDSFGVEASFGRFGFYSNSRTTPSDAKNISRGVELNFSPSYISLGLIFKL